MSNRIPFVVDFSRKIVPIFGALSVLGFVGCAAPEADSATSDEAATVAAPVCETDFPSGRKLTYSDADDRGAFADATNAFVGQVQAGCKEPFVGISLDVATKTCSYNTCREGVAEDPHCASGDGHHGFAGLCESVCASLERGDAPELTIAERAAIKYYTGDGYTSINPALYAPSTDASARETLGKEEAPSSRRSPG